MKTAILKIGSDADGASGIRVYPVTFSIDGLESTDEIPVTEVAEKEKSLLLDPGSFRGRDLGGEDVLPAPNRNAPGTNAAFALWLHGLVFGKKLASQWQTLEDSAAAGFRLILDIVPKELSRLRWEQIGSSPVFPGRDPSCAVVRGKFDPGARVPLRDGPLRILVVVGSAKDDPNVLADQEVAALRTASRTAPTRSS